MINRVILTGRPTKDLNLIKGDETGTPVCSFTLAVDRKFKNKHGEREADFIRCVAWKKTAEIMSQYVRKGSLIGVDGRIQTRSYISKNDQRVYVTEVVVESFSFLGGQDNQRQQPSTQDSQPFSSSGSKEVEFDDLPF